MPNKMIYSIDDLSHDTILTHRYRLKRISGNPYSQHTLIFKIKYKFKRSQTLFDLIDK